jgi:hypothetical protein
MTTDGIEKIANISGDNNIIIDGSYVYIGTQYFGEEPLYRYDPKTKEMIVIE